MQVILQFINLLISGVSSVFNFFLGFWSMVRYSVQMLPIDLGTCLLVCFGIIVSVRVLELLP